MDQNPTSPLPPFSVKFNPQLPELIGALNCTIAISTYQAGKLLLITAPDDERLSLLGRNFNKPMGVTTKGDKLAIACKSEVHVFRNSTELANHYPVKKSTYDGLYVPRATYYTGMVDIHDIAWGNEGLWAVNTSFSSLCLINDDYSFTPKWQPHFIDRLVHEDRCHLNGLVMQSGVPKYVTALGNTNTRQGWRTNIISGGILMDVTENKIILDQLPMPHSPKLIGSKIYFLLSASGAFVAYDLETQQLETIKELQGFCRGLAISGEYAFVGMSKLRKNSSTFAKLPFGERANFAGIKVIHIPSKSLVGEIEFKTSVDEIYDLLLLPYLRNPNILNTERDIHQKSLHLPNDTFWASDS